MVIGDYHESGMRLTVTRFTESRADEKENRRLLRRRRRPGTEIIDWEMGRENWVKETGRYKRFLVLQIFSSFTFVVQNKLKFLFLWVDKIMEIFVYFYYFSYIDFQKFWKRNVELLDDFILLSYFILLITYIPYLIKLIIYS